MSGHTTSGREMVQVQSLVQIIDNLPAQLELQAAAWDPVDRALSERLRIPFRRTTLKAPALSSYFSGARLGVLSIPWEKFPTLATMSDRATPNAESAKFDFGQRVYNDTLYVECIVASDAFESSDAEERVFQEGLVDRRAKRMSEAIAQCLEVDVTLGGLVEDILASDMAQTDPFDIDSDQPGMQSQSMVFSLIRAQWNLTVYSDRPDASQPSPNVLPDGFGAFSTEEV